MEFKKKTIIWEDNNIPPKDYLWVKSDGKIYEFNNTTRQWQESKTLQLKGQDGSESETPSNISIDFSKITFKEDLQERLEALTFEEVEGSSVAYPNWTTADVVNDDYNFVKTMFESNNINEFYFEDELSNINRDGNINSIVCYIGGYVYYIVFTESDILKVSFIERQESQYSGGTPPIKNTKG